MTEENKNTGSSFPVFTIIAGLLLIAKLTAYPEISWGIIIGVWFIPLIMIAIIFSLGIFTAGCIFLMAFLFK